MVKVIGQDKSVTKEVTCKNCEARLSYYKKDIKSYTSKDYTGSIDVNYYIECPSCKENVFVKRY